MDDHKTGLNMNPSNYLHTARGIPKVEGLSEKALLDSYHIDLESVIRADREQVCYRPLYRSALEGALVRKRLSEKEPEGLGHQMGLNS